MNIYNKKIKTTRLSIFDEVKDFAVSEDQHLIINGMPGTGKTYTTVQALLKARKKVLVLKKTNSNVEEFARSIGSKLSNNAQYITSREYRIKEKYGVTPPTMSSSNFFDAPKLKSDELIAREIIKYNPELILEDVLEEINDIQNVRSSFEDVDLVVMTHARLPFVRMNNFSIKAKQNKNLMDKTVWGLDLIPEDVVIVVDDPDINTFKTHFEVKANNASHQSFRSSINVTIHKDRHGREYFVKPDNRKLIHQLNNKFVYTTTEVIVKELICSQVDARVMNIVDLLDSDASGDIHFIVTPDVNSKNHHLLKVMLQRINKIQRRNNNNCISFLGDGVGNYINTYTSRGSNELTSTDNVIKASCSYTGLLFELSCQLEDMDRNVMGNIIANDTVTQMIGRNRGYRYVDTKSKKVKNSECIVLIDRKLFKYVSENCPYQIKSVTKINNKREAGPIPETKSTLDIMLWLMNNREQYIEFGYSDKGNGGYRSFKQDVLDALKSTVLDKRHELIYNILKKVIEPKVSEYQDKTLYAENTTEEEYSSNERNLEKYEHLEFWLNGIVLSKLNEVTV